LGEAEAAAQLVTDHARILLGWLEESSDPTYQTGLSDDDFHFIFALLFGVDSALARDDRALADALFERAAE
jgi:hypothetical protein